LAEVFDVVYEEGIGGLVMSKENYLSAKFSKVVDCCGTNSSCAALCLNLAESLEVNINLGLLTVTIITLECIRRWERFVAPPQYSLIAIRTATAETNFATFQ
jgi:hypothetical protein